MITPPAAPVVARRPGGAAAPPPYPSRISPPRFRTSPRPISERRTDRQSISCWPGMAPLCKWGCPQLAQLLRCPRGGAAHVGSGTISPVAFRHCTPRQVTYLREGMRSWAGPPMLGNGGSSPVVDGPRTAPRQVRRAVPPARRRPLTRRPRVRRGAALPTDPTIWFRRNPMKFGDDLRIKTATLWFPPDREPSRTPSRRTS